MPIDQEILVLIIQPIIKKNRKDCYRKENLTHDGNLNRLSSDFSEETLQVRREWNNIHNPPNFQSRILYPQNHLPDMMKK